MVVLLMEVVPCQSRSGVVGIKKLRRPLEAFRVRRSPAEPHLMFLRGVHRETVGGLKCRAR